MRNAQPEAFAGLTIIGLFRIEEIQAQRFFLYILYEGHMDTGTEFCKSDLEGHTAA